MRFKNAIICAIGTLLMTGCQSAHVAKSVTADLGKDDPDSQIDFWHTLAEQKLASNDDVMHGILLYLDDHDPNASYSERVAALEKRGLLRSKFNEPADVAVHRGTVAVIFAKALSIRGGWQMTLFGATPRTATKEMTYLQIFPYSSEQQTFSGSEFVGVIGALEDYQRTQKSPQRPSTRPIAPPASADAVQSADPIVLNDQLGH